MLEALHDDGSVCDRAVVVLAGGDGFFRTRMVRTTAGPSQVLKTSVKTSVSSSAVSQDTARSVLWTGALPLS